MAAVWPAPDGRGRVRPLPSTPPAGPLPYALGLVAHRLTPLGGPGAHQLLTLADPWSTAPAPSQRHVAALLGVHPQTLSDAHTRFTAVVAAHRLAPPPALTAAVAVLRGTTSAVGEGDVAARLVAAGVSPVPTHPTVVTRWARWWQLPRPDQAPRPAEPAGPPGMTRAAAAAALVGRALLAGPVPVWWLLHVLDEAVQQERPPGPTTTTAAAAALAAVPHLQQTAGRATLRPTAATPPPEPWDDDLLQATAGAPVARVRLLGVLAAHGIADADLLATLRAQPWLAPLPDEPLMWDRAGRLPIAPLRPQGVAASAAPREG